MKLLFTKSEYRTLIDMIYVGEWMLTAHDEETNPAKEKYVHLVQKIYSHAKEMGWEALIESSAADNEYFTTAEYEQKSGIHDLIDDYDAESFWDQLVDRLTDRDVSARVGAKEQEKLSHEEYMAIADPIAGGYEIGGHGGQGRVTVDGHLLHGSKPAQGLHHPYSGLFPVAPGDVVVSQVGHKGWQVGLRQVRNSAG